MSTDTSAEPATPWWLRIDEFIAAIALIATVLSVAWGVVTRYLFPQPAPWAYEVAVIAFAWCVFFGAAVGVRLRLHADIDVVVALFPKAAQRAVDIFNWLLLAALFAILAVLFAWQAALTLHVYTIALSLPRTVLYAPLAVACLMMLGHHLMLWGYWNRSVPAPEYRDPA